MLGKKLGIVAAIAGIGLVSSMVGIPQAVAQTARAQLVEVVNPPERPVPTAAQGTTNVAGTVNIGNTPSVAVTNTVPVANALPESTFWRGRLLAVGDNSGNTCSNCADETLFNVPDGKTAVIEHVSVWMRATPRVPGRVYLSTSSGLMYFPVAFVDEGDDLNSQGQTTSRTYIGSTPLRMLVPAVTDGFFASNELRASMRIDGPYFATPDPYKVEAHVLVSGYLIDGVVATNNSEPPPTE